jgi:hypothetical protein
LDKLDPPLNRVTSSLLKSAQRQISVPGAASATLGLPLPHPLDFEWRFAQGAIATLTDATISLAPPGATVALISTPTFAATPVAALADRAIDYWGLDAQALCALGLTAHLRWTHRVDFLRKCLPDESYSVVVMDPPWYEEYMRRSLYFAAAAVAVDGHLLLAMPALGTRPDIAQENERALEWTEQLGFVLKSVERGCLRYETPLFERNALRAAGILNVGAEWRRGDLWILRKEASHSMEWPGDLACQPWQEIVLEGVRVRVDTDATPVGVDPSLRTIVHGDVLPSVSRRDPRRAAVRVWTSGNRVFSCDAPATFLSMAQSWAGNSCRPRSADDARCHAREHFLSIIDRERRECSEWSCARLANCETS